MLCKVCQTESPNPHCSQRCKQHEVCLVNKAVGTQDEQELAAQAIQRAQIMELFPDIHDEVKARYNELESRRTLLLARMKELKAEGNKAELKVVTKAKDANFKQVAAYKAARRMLGTWSSYYAFDQQSDQCLAFRRWRGEVEDVQEHLDEAHGSTMGEMIRLIAPR